MLTRTKLSHTGNMPTPVEAPPPAIAAMCAVVAGFIAVRGVVLWRRVRGTTLAAPAVWMVVVATFMAIVEAALAAQSHPGDTFGASIARYAAAVGTFCPLMAVLGAKRPQDRGWQWIVLSLWIVLLVPAGQAWAARTSGELQLASMWKIMILALMTLTVLNYLPTGRALSACFTSAAQWMLFKGWLFDYGNQTTLAASICFLVAALIPPSIQVGSPPPDRPALKDFTHRWLAFRNAWGAFWALRILQRVNETATLSHWPVLLEWSGFVPANSEALPQLDERTAAHIEQTLDTLLRRFERTSS